MPTGSYEPAYSEVYQAELPGDEVRKGRGALMTTMVGNLSDIAMRLEKDLGGAGRFGPLSTRVLLRTGVNLRAIKPEQVNDRDLIAKVSAALSEMGY